jgi:TM2 domain-containing membrane protein YozV
MDNNTQTINTAAPAAEQKVNIEWVIVLLFAFFLGWLGVHRFYVGKIGTGILMIVTFGGLGIWALIDLIIVAVGQFKKKDGTLIPVFK